VPASAQDGRLKAALTACMTWAMTHPLPQMLDVDNAVALVYACEGQPALALLNAMELVSNQTIDGDVIARRSGGIVCGTPQVPCAEHLHNDHRGHRAVR
jgi:hypothetical protein